MTRAIRGRSREPLCPFCVKPFERPHDIKTELGNVFIGGKCDCGAAYVFDRSGHNLGEAYVDVLVFACGGDWDAAWKLTPDIDYKIESCYYDPNGHKLIDIAQRGGRSRENLLFIRVNKREMKISQDDK